MAIKTVLNIDPLDVGWLIAKDGGSAKFVYAAKTIAQLLDTVAEVYGYRLSNLELEPVAQQATQRLPEIPAATQALIDRNQDDDVVTGLNIDTAAVAPVREHYNAGYDK